MFRGILIALLTMCVGIVTSFGPASVAQAAPDDTNAPAQQVQSAAQSIGSRATDTVNQIRQQGLSPEAIIAWVVLGALAGIVAGGIFRPRAGPVGVVLNLILGGIGAFLGGFAVKVLGLDFGWPVITFKSESLLLALIFSFALVLLYRGLLRRVHKATSDGSAIAAAVKQ
jgi:uncharacterized membrane protein YeaQ/YmgE (transglycosylase-associated protein family)